MNEHTPGPWKLDSTFPDPDGYKIRGGSLVFRKGPRLIAVVKNQGDRPIVEDSLSDARLIAAAPDLLAALKTAEGHLSEELGYKELHPIGHCPVLDVVRAAIAKAEGLS